MDRRSLLTAGIAGAAGIAVGGELGAAPAGAAADVDRAEFEALKAHHDHHDGPAARPEVLGQRVAPRRLRGAIR